jgi:hypothetical protein
MYVGTHTSTNRQRHVDDSSYTSVNTDNACKVSHQNIRGLKDKSNEFISFCFQSSAMYYV